MNEILKINGLNVFVNDKLLLSNFSFEMKSFLCVLGESGSGKTCLLKQIIQYIPIEVSPFCEFYFGEEEKVSDWKKFLNYEEMSEDFQLFCHDFFQNGKFIPIKCMLVKKILHHPKYFFLDDVSLSIQDFSFFCQFLRKLGILLFYVTNDIEKVLFCDYLYVLKNNQIAVEGESRLVLKEEKLMKVLGFSLPFYVNLSIQLGYYGLLSDIYYNKEDMEVALWQSK